MRDHDTNFIEALRRCRKLGDTMTLIEAHQHLFSDEVPPMTDREAEEFVEREEAIAQEDGKVEYLAPPPSEILVLARQDSREVYTDSEDCPRDGDFEHMNWQDLAGVY